MIIEIKDLPKNAKSITIDKIVIEFNDGDISENSLKAEVNQSLNSPEENPKGDNTPKSSIPEMQTNEEVEPIPEEMTDMEF